MNATSQFFILDVKPTVKEQETAQTNTNSPYNLETPLTRPKLPSKFIKKWSEYADDTVVQKSVSAVNGDLSFSLPIVQVNLTPFLKIDIDLVYMVGKNGIEFEVPLTKSFISIDHQKSIFRNDAIFLLNSMGSKMILESVGTNRFKMLEDVKGEVDVTYYPDQEYFTVESALEKLVYGKFGDTGTVLYELSYRHWRETGNDPQSLIKIPVAWYLAERHSKSDDRVIYYRYETLDVPHQLNPQVSYTSEVMLKSIDDGNDVKVQFEYGHKESSENEELKLKMDDGNLRMGNFIVDKHFLNRIKVETETYEQDFGLTYELFDGKTRVPKEITQIMLDGKAEKMLRFKNQKISGSYFPSHIGVFHGVTTKFTYESQVVPSPQLEKKFILKNRPVISYGSNVIAFSSIIDNRVVLKIFKIKTFKLQKEISIIDKNSIDITSLQVGFSENFMIVTYKTNDERNLSIYYQNGRENWHDNPTIRKFSKDSKVYMTGRDFAIVHDQLTLTVLQKKWNENALMIQSFYTKDENMKVIIKGKSIFLRENSNLHVVFKGDDGEWKMKLLKNDISSSAVRIASLFDVNDDVRKAIQRPLEENEIRVMNNIVILSNLIFRPNKQFRTVFTFITVNDNYDVKSEEELWEDREIISDLVTTFPIDGTNLTVKYQKSGNNYVLRVVDFDGAAARQIEAMPNKNQRFIERLNFINSWNKNDKFIQHMKSQFLLKWNKYYPIQENGKNDLYFSEDIQFRMTGTKWTKDEIASQRTVHLGDKFKLIFNSENPNNVELIGQSDEDYKLNLFLKHPQMLINMYPQYIAYQPDTGITKLIVFDDGQKVVAHVTFNNEDLMFESNQGYFITIKKSLDLSHSEPYELIVRNMAQYLTDKSQVVVKMTEMWKNMKDYPKPVLNTSDSDTRVMSYERSFNVNKKLWTAVVKTMNGYTADENGWVEYYVSRNDESDIKQVTSYYDSNKKLLKSETKIDEKSNTTGKDFSDNLLYDESGKLQVANIFPYKMSEDVFGYCGFEDYERTDNWTFDKHKVIKNGFVLTGKNYLRLERGEKFEKSFIPKNKEEIFTAAAWIRSKALNINQPTGNFKAIISYSVNGKDFKELYGILGKITSKSGEWLYAEISIDILTFIRGSYNNHKLQNPNLPAFEVVDIKITLAAFGPDLDIDNVVFYPAPHHLSINVYNSNRDATAAIHNEGQITRIYYDSITLKEIGRTKKNGKLEQFLVRSEGEKDSPKVVTKFSLSSGFHETFDNFMFASRWKINNERNWKVFPSELMYENDNSDGTIEVRDEKVMDIKSAALRLEMSLDSNKTSKFELKFASDSIKFISNGRNQAELNVNNQKVADIPQHFELAVFKYLNRTILWINGIIMLDEMQIDIWKDFTINCLGTVAIRDLFILNNPKIEVFYQNSFDEQQQVIKFVSENSAVITQYIYDKYGREIVKSKPTKVTKSSSEPLLKFHKNFIKSFDEQTSKIEGNVVAENPVDNGYPFFHTKYLKNPLNEKQKIGQPGHDYSINSNFSTTYSKDIDIPFLTAYFPEGEGFTSHAENLSNGSIRVLVLDKNGNKVAKYVQVPNFDDIFMTFEHDLDGRVVKVLSPKYHEATETLYSIDKTYKIGDAHLTEDEKELQKQLCSHYKYDKNGNAIEKQTPDTGRQVFLYNSMNLLKFSITYNADPKDGQTIYYNYDSAGLLTETGHITRPVSVEYLKKFVDSNFHTEAIEFQKIQFNEGKSKIIETINHDTTVLEEIQFDENEEDKIVSRKMTVPAITESLQTSFNLQRLYNGDHVEVLTYPTTDEGKILKVKHTYNGVGQLIGIGTAEKPFCFAKFTYDANGQPTSEIHELNNLNRKYSYNSPGYMNKIDDEFMSEDISYIDGGYGQLGYGDGIVMKTAYNAKWSDEYFKKNEQDKNDDDYGDGILEEDEEANLRLENQKNLNSIKIATVNQLRNRIIQERYPSSNEDSVENSIENRRKRQTSFISAPETIKSMGSHSDIQPRPKQLKLEDILGKFKGFAVDGLRVKHFKNPGSIHEASSDPEANTTKRIKRNFNIQNEATSRQSKINKILTNPGIDSCITSLKDTTFITKNDLKFSKILNTNAEVNLPLKCFDNKIYDEISARHQIPKNYGHRYTYGTHRELVKSKYFSTKAEEEAEPLQMNTFNEKMSGIDFYRSHNIFNVLRDGNFIAVDRRRKDKKSSIGTKGTTALIREDDLNQLLDELGSEFVDLFPVVQQLILHTIENKKILEYSDFEKMFLNWKSASTNTVKVQLDKFKRNAKTLFDSLIREALLPTSLETFISPLNKKLIFDLKRYEKSQIVEIVGILSKSFNYELLTTAFDTASYEIDANGNHKKFSTGFDSVKLDYHENTSKLKTLEVKGQQYTVDHDGYGNMTSAPHKGVKKIIYHPVSRRVMEVLLTNGGSIKFHYNSQGERILKQVYDSKYEITKEILYIRDEDGNVLMDRVMNFDQKDKTCYEVVTHYIYGPRGMIGFIRDDKFHSIFTDHSGSVRLVIRDGKVVASYDYLPYGEMMRKFISDDTADIRYLYHGKELDDESDTYNFHARFYDPTIGRFLQTDPQSQYFSPYKFSGNSPVSFVDPDGEFALLLALGFGILGAYLSTAAHNKSWNPAKWDFADPGTYFSMFSGALTGAFFPSGVAGAIGTLYYVATPAAMAFTAYISAAAANNNWNPAEWKFNSPETYSAIFFGLSAGVSLVKGVDKYLEFAKTLGLGGKIVLIGASGLSALGAFYSTGLEQNEGNKYIFQWNYTSPLTIKAILDGFTLGLSMPMNANTLRKDIMSFTKNPKALKEFLKNLTPKNIHNLKEIFSNREHPFYILLGSVGYGYLMGSVKNKDFNLLNWNLNVGTIASVVSGMTGGKALSKSLAVITKAEIKATLSSEWKDVKGIGPGIRRQYLTLERNMIRLGHRSANAFTRIRSTFTKSSEVEYIALREMTISQKLRDDWLMTPPGRIAFLDRQTSLLTPCRSRRRKRTIQGGICQSLKTNWNIVRDVFTRKDMNAVFENTAIISQLPGIFNSGRGFISLSRSLNDDLPVEATDYGELSFDRNPSPKSEPGLVMFNKTYIEIDTNDRQKRGTDKPLIIMTDQIPGAAIYTRENNGKLEIYHQYTEQETTIALTPSNNTAPAFYDTKNGLKIDELANVNVLRLFDRHNNELKMMRGTIKIPDDGLVKYVQNGEFKVLRSINSTPIREVVIKNQQIRRKNAENVQDKLPNFTESCDTCKVIYWEDHLPAGVIDTAYNLNIDRQLKATVVIYKDDKDNWKLSSQLIQYNKEKAGAPEIAEIRPKPKIFDLKLTAKKAEEVKDNQSRKPRNVNFVPEDANVPARNYKFIDNSTQNFNHQTPSVLDLGDFWLNATDFNSNLTLAYAFLKKWTNETLFSTNEGNMPKITDIEFEIFANDLTNDFTENILESAIKCGIPTVMRDILDEINLQKISNEVKRKCEKNLTEEIPKYLMREILEKNEKKIVGKSSKKQFEKLKRLMTGYLEEFADDLTARNDKLWNGE